MALASLVRLDENFNDRVNEIKKDLQKISELKDKKKRLIKLERLRDELSGYCIRLHQANLKAEQLYKLNTPKIKSMQDLGKAIEQRFYTDQQYNDAKKLKNQRDNSAHPHSHWVASDFLIDADINKKLIKNSISQLKSLYLTDEVSITREKTYQDRVVDNRFKTITDVFDEIAKSFTKNSHGS